MSVNGWIAERETRHQIFIQRFAGGEYRKLKPILRGLRADILAQMALSPDDFRSIRAERLIQSLDRVINDRTAQISDSLLRGLEEFAQYEVKFQAAMIARLGVEASIPSAAAVAAAVSTKPAVLGARAETIPQMVSRFSGGINRSVLTTIQSGAIDGRTIQQMTRDVSRLITTRTAREAEALVRTSVNHIGNIARTAVYEANSDVIVQEEWVATLDARTTLVCAGRDGKKYPVGQGDFPPAHYGCRSIRTPVIDPALRIPGFEGERASVRGPVSANTTYDGFLRSQSQEFQNEVLGPERASLFRAGMPVDRFTDDAGRTLTLDELRQREGLTLQ
jgi:SPP1 gp7 family putative phage head morphogenesis protein